VRTHPRKDNVCDKQPAVAVTRGVAREARHRERALRPGSEPFLRQCGACDGTARAACAPGAALVLVPVRTCWRSRMRASSVSSNGTTSRACTMGALPPPAAGQRAIDNSSRECRALTSAAHMGDRQVPAGEVAPARVIVVCADPLPSTALPTWGGAGRGRDHGSVRMREAPLSCAELCDERTHTMGWLCRPDLPEQGGVPPRAPIRRGDVRQGLRAPPAPFGHDRCSVGVCLEQNFPNDLIARSVSWQPRHSGRGLCLGGW